MKKESNIVEEALNEANTTGGGGSMATGGGSMFGGAKYGGSGTFSGMSHTKAKSWAPQSPPSRGTTTSPTASDLTGIMQAEEEEAHQAPPLKAYPLGMIDDNLVQAFIFLSNAISLMTTCLKKNVVITTSKEKKKSLELIRSKALAMKDMLREISDDLTGIDLS